MYHNVFQRILSEQPTLALATSMGSIPNVRIVHFVYLESYKRIFFVSFKNNPKVFAFAQNPHVAFTTIPTGSLEYVRGMGIVSHSDLSLQEMAHHFIEKIPDTQESFYWDWKELLLFEIKITSHTITSAEENISESSM